MRIHENIGENVLGGGNSTFSPPDAEFTSESHDVVRFWRRPKHYDFLFITILKRVISNYLSMGKVFIFFSLRFPRPSEIKSRPSKKRKANPSWNMKVVYRLRKAIFVLTFLFFFERVKLTAKFTCRIEFHVSSSLPACGSICLWSFLFLVHLLALKIYTMFWLHTKIRRNSLHFILICLILSATY